MKEIADLLFNYGVGIACIVYLMYFHNTTMKEMLKTLESIANRLTAIETILDINDKKEKE